MKLDKLKDKFPADALEWRVQATGLTRDNKPWVRVLTYITARAIQDRLDEVVGPENWQTRFKSGPKDGVICGIGIQVGDQWVWKWDGADNTEIESIKGGLSSAFKRAAVPWGIGRYLYKLPVTYAKVSDKGTERAKIRYKDNGKSREKWIKWEIPSVPAEFLPEGARPKNPDRKKPSSNKKSGGNEKDKPFRFQYLEDMGEIKNEIGEDKYYEILQREFAIKKSSDVILTERMKEILERMHQVAKEVEGG